MTTKTKGTLLCLFGASCWGISGCTGQYLFTHQGMDSSWLVPIRLLLAGLLLCGFYLAKDRKLLIAPWRTRRNAIDLVLYGLVGVSGAQYTYFLTIQLASASISTILQDLSPAMILVCVCVLARRRPRRLEVLCVALALVGVFFIATHGSFTEMAVSPKALIAGILSAVCVVVYTLVPKNLQAQYPTPLLQGWAFVMGGIFFGLVFRSWQIAYTPNAIGVLGIIVVVIVGNVLAFTCYMQGVKLIGPQRASLYSMAEPVTAALISTLVLHSAFTIWDAAGFLCILTMIVLVSMPEKEKHDATG